MRRINFWMANGFKRLCHDARGVVSFEYVIVAASVIAMVAAVFDAGTSSFIATTLTNAVTSVCAALASAV